MVGDSHALMWFRSMGDLAQPRGVRVRLFATGSCAPFQDSVAKPSPHCLLFQESSRKLLKAWAPTHVVLIWLWKLDYPYLPHAELIADAAAWFNSVGGARVVLLDSGPVLPRATPTVLAAPYSAATHPLATCACVARNCHSSRRMRHWQHCCIK